MDRLTQLCLLLEVVTECLMPMPITIGETVNTAGCWFQTYNMIADCTHGYITKAYHVCV